MRVAQAANHLRCGGGRKGAQNPNAGAGGLAPAADFKKDYISTALSPVRTVTENPKYSQ